MTETNQHRRRFERVAVRCGCWLERDDESVFGTTIDLGLGGLFFRTATPFAVGADVEVRLNLGDEREPIIAHGTVAWSTGGRPGALAGVGVEFRDIARGETALREFVGLAASGNYPTVT